MEGKMGKMEEKTSGVIAERIKELDNTAHLMETNISRLINKIEPILSPERNPKNSDSGDKVAKESSALSCQIDGINSLLQTLTERLREVIDRAET